MEKKTIISKLNQFYTFELNQVDLYTAQSKSFQDTYSSVALERIAYIEQQHVDNLAEKIKELGGQPTSLGDLISPLIGKFIGKTVAVTGLKNTLKLNIFLENHAIKSYQEFIASLEKESTDLELLKILKHNLIDEDLHTAWFIKELSDNH